MAASNGLAAAKDSSGVIRRAGCLVAVLISSDTVRSSVTDARGLTDATAVRNVAIVSGALERMSSLNPKLVAVGLLKPRNPCAAGRYTIGSAFHSSVLKNVDRTLPTTPTTSRHGSLLKRTRRPIAAAAPPNRFCAAGAFRIAT